MTNLTLLFAIAISASTPAKMIVATANGVAITDYPSIDRCERARLALLAAWQHDAEVHVPQGYKMVVPPSMSAVCVPG